MSRILTNLKREYPCLSMEKEERDGKQERG
jgi:hypothetical protein